MEQNTDTNTVSEILFFDPVCKETIWGGSRLRDEFHYPGAGAHTGECWGISAHPNGDGTVKNGTFAGKKLSDVWKEAPQLFAGPAQGDFPLMVKIIDAKEDLSIQVHPDDTYARVHENGSYGKTECWYIMDCEQPASLIIGHHASTKEELSAMIAQGRWNQLLREVPIQKGDFIQIDPGTIHAIKGGCLILETQQSSDITYRLYDYDRRSNGVARKLHIQQALDVITVPEKEIGQCKWHADGMPKNKKNLLYRCPYYQIFLLDIAGRFGIDPSAPYLLMSVVEGEGMLDQYPVRKGDHLIIPNGYGEAVVTGDIKFIASAPGENYGE